MSTLSNIQAAVVTAITQIVALLVSFALISNTEAGIVISATTAVVNVAFLVGNSIERSAAIKAGLRS